MASLQDALDTCFASSATNPGLSLELQATLRQLRRRLEDGELPPGMGLIAFQQQQDELLALIDDVQARSAAVHRLRPVRAQLDLYLKNASEDLDRLEQLGDALRRPEPETVRAAELAFEKHCARRIKQKHKCEADLKKWERAVHAMAGSLSKRGVEAVVAAEAKAFGWYVELNLAVEQLINIALRIRAGHAAAFLTAVDSKKFVALSAEIALLVSPLRLASLDRSGVGQAARGGAEPEPGRSGDRSVAARAEKHMPKRFTRPFRFSGGVLVDDEEEGPPGAPRTVGGQCTAAQIARQAGEIAAALARQKRAHDRRTQGERGASGERGDGGAAHATTARAHAARRGEAPLASSSEHALSSREFLDAGGAESDAFKALAAAFLEDDYGLSPEADAARADGLLRGNFVDFVAENVTTALAIGVVSLLFWTLCAVLVE